jgi:hypothetical protein
MIDLRRYRNLLIGAPCLGLLVAGINFLLLAITGPAPDWLVPRLYPMGWNWVERTAARVSGLEAACGPPAANGCHPLLVYLGQSGAQEGIDPAVLHAHLGTDLRLVGICGSGSGMYPFRALSEPLLRSRLRPALTVLCIHPVWLIGNPTPQPPASLDPFPALFRGDWQEVGQIVGWWNWLARNRHFVNYAARTQLHAAQARLGGAAVDPHPWRPPERAGNLYWVGEEKLRWLMAEYERRGWFDPAQYARFQEGQAAALVDLISRLRGHGGAILILLMPERSGFRTRIPPAARCYLLGTIREHFPDLPAVLDFQDAIPDEMFSDWGHLNDTGRERFSLLLADALRDRCPR